MMIKKVDEKTRRKFSKLHDSEIPNGVRCMFRLMKNYLFKKKVLDVGCWTGHYERLGYKYVKQITGIDPGEEAIRNATKSFKGIDNVKFMTGQAESIKLKSATFDVCVFMDVIEHLESGNEIKALKEIKRVLKPNGNLILSTPLKNLLSVIFDPAFFILKHRHYSIPELNTLLNKSGFEITELKKVGGLALVLTYNLEMFLKHIFNTNLKHPLWLDKKINDEFNHEGFSEIFLIARSK